MCGMVCGEGREMAGRYAKVREKERGWERRGGGRNRGGKVSRGHGRVPRVIDCLLRKDEASSLPAAEVISFEKARAFSPGSGFEEERRNGNARAHARARARAAMER